MYSIYSIDFNNLNILSIIILLLLIIIVNILLQYVIDIFRYINFCKKYYNLSFSFIETLKISNIYNKNYINTYGIIKFLLYLLK